MIDNNLQHTIRKETITMNLNLGKNLESFINHSVDTDIAYNNASEWVRDAIREKINRDREYYDKLEALKNDIDIGIKQVKNGEFSEINFEQLIKETNK